MKIGVRVAASSIFGLAVFGLILFLPAGTLNYWQAWVFIGVFTAATIIPTIYLARTNPAALQRRMHAGPRAEARTLRRSSSPARFWVSVRDDGVQRLDHRFGWSPVPAWLSRAGRCPGGGRDSVSPCWWSSRTVMPPPLSRWRAGQTLVSDRRLRIRPAPDVCRKRDHDGGHPAGARLLLGTVSSSSPAAGARLRILDEEKLLTQELGGYREYTQRVRYRLVPYMW